MNSNNKINYACPKCKKLLNLDSHALFCHVCEQDYPFVDGIPDFVKETVSSESNPLLNMAKKMDLLAAIYESKIWYQFVLKMAGAKNSTMASILNFHSESLQNVHGAIMDVACGTATYGRCLVSQTRDVYGIDISMGMLNKGQYYIERDRISDVHLSRASVNALPFADETFDGAICSGSLHLFPDTFVALREIARTLKTGAPLSIQTFIAGNSIVARVLKTRSWAHIHPLTELMELLMLAGFHNTKYTLDGSTVLTIQALK